MAFLNSFIFPEKISSGSQAKPRWATEVVTTDSGYEYRNQPWSYPLYTYDVAYGVKEIPDLETLLAAFHAARGMTDGFRFLDPLDSKSCARDSTPASSDQTLIASATGGETTAQLIKTYTYGGASLDRKITRPYGIVLVEKNGSPLTLTTDYTIDMTTGIITFVVPLTIGDTIKAGYTFHVPVRFDSNSISITMQEYTYGTATVPLVELKE